MLLASYHLVQVLYNTCVVSVNNHWRRRIVMTTGRRVTHPYVTVG